VSRLLLLLLDMVGKPRAHCPLLVSDGLVQDGGEDWAKDAKDGGSGDEARIQTECSLPRDRKQLVLWFGG
jgi:hypothetical protein